METNIRLWYEDQNKLLRGRVDSATDCYIIVDEDKLDRACVQIKPKPDPQVPASPPVNRADWRWLRWRNGSGKTDSSALPSIF